MRTEGTTGSPEETDKANHESGIVDDPGRVGLMLLKASTPGPSPPNRSGVKGRSRPCSGHSRPLDTAPRHASSARMVTTDCDDSSNERRRSGFGYYSTRSIRIFPSPMRTCVPSPSASCGSFVSSHVNDFSSPLSVVTVISYDSDSVMGSS